MTGRVGLTGALVYTTISLAAAAIFLGVTLLGDYPWVAKAGGSAWVFSLSMIVLMPLVTSLLKKRLGRSSDGPDEPVTPPHH